MPTRIPKEQFLAQASAIFGAKAVGTMIHTLEECDCNQPHCMGWKMELSSLPDPDPIFVFQPGRLEL